MMNIVLFSERKLRLLWDGSCAVNPTLIKPFLFYCAITMDMLRLLFQSRAIKPDAISYQMASVWYPIIHFYVLLVTFLLCAIAFSCLTFFISFVLRRGTCFVGVKYQWQFSSRVTRTIWASELIRIRITGRGSQQISDEKLSSRSFKISIHTTLFDHTEVSLTTCMIPVREQDQVVDKIQQPPSTDVRCVRKKEMSPQSGSTDIW